MYAPEDRYVWDYWLVREGPTYHLFHLQAPRSLGDPDRRHEHSSIGHATSTDLVNWTTRPGVLQPDTHDTTTHTGSVVWHDGRYVMLYSGWSHGRRAVFRAESIDLDTWHKSPREPVLRPDARWYDAAGTWADPYLIADPDHPGAWLVYVKATDRRHPSGLGGCVGAARTRDLRNFEVLEPVWSPGTVREPEVPAVYRLGERWALVVMLIPPCCSDRYRSLIAPRVPQWGDVILWADHPLGPFTSPTGDQLTIDADQKMMIRLIDAPGVGGLVALSWWQGYADYWKDGDHRPHTTGVGPCVLNDPVPARLDTTTGRLVLG